MKISIADGDRIREAVVVRSGDEIVVTGPDEQKTLFRLLTAGPGRLVLALSDRILVLRGEDISRRERQLHVGGRSMVYAVATSAAADGTAKAELGASIPSVVLEVLVQEGQSVASGERLILLESMKMVMPIVAPSAGTVRALLCAVGDSVMPGVPLVDFAVDGAH